MKKVGILLGLAGITALSCGCGTVLNTLYFTPSEGGMNVYGGVRLDGQLAKECLSGENGFGEQGIGKRAISTTAAVIDIPFSAVGDTLTMPYVFANKWVDQREADSHKNFGKHVEVDP